MRGQFPLSDHSRGVLTLFAATLLWGTSYVATKGAIGNLPPSWVVFGRFAIASLCFLPWIKLRPGLVLAGLELGLWLLGGYSTQTISLLYTATGRSAFIASLYVIFVPILLGFAGRRILPVIWLAVGMAFGGISLLSSHGGTANVGDLWALGTGFCWALYIIRLEGFAQTFPTLSLTAMQVSSIALLSSLWVVFDPATRATLPMDQPTAWLAVLYLGIMTTALTTWLQTLGQMRVSPPEAVVIYTLEPVSATLLAFLVFQETLTLPQILGAGLIFAATLISQFRAQS